MSTFMIILIVILGIIFLGFLVSTIDAIIAFFSPFPGQNDIDKDPGVKHLAEQAEMLKGKAKETSKIEYERVYINSFDDLLLSAKMYERDKNKPYILLMHGYRGLPERDFAYVLPMLLEQNYNVLMIDERACGKSDGHAVTFGIKERKDAREWIYYLLDRYGKDIDICMYGISMGAASVLMASEFNLPKQVKCIVADCPYSTPKDIIKKVTKNIKLPPVISFYLLRLSAYFYCRMDMEEASAVEAVKHTDLPIILIHGEEDLFVPCDMSRLIEENCNGYVERYTFPKADHAFSVLVDYDRYKELVIGFINKHI